MDTESALYPPPAVVPVEEPPAVPDTVGGRFRLARWRVRRWVRANQIRFTLGLLVLAFAVVYLFPRIFISIPPGHTGVLWSWIYGTETDVLYPEGLHVIFPWNDMYIYNMRYQKLDSTARALSKDGLEIDVEMAVRFRPELKLLAKLHKQVGPDYVQTIIVPEAASAARAVIGRYRPDELYTASFSAIEDEVVRMMRELVQRRFVFVDDVQIRKVTLPRAVADAIQRKLQQEQASLEMRYRIYRERQEADRKRIEAEGIREYQALVQSTLTRELLQFKGIEASFELAKSNNAKVIMYGSGQGALPVISIGPDALAPPTPAPGSVNRGAPPSPAPPLGQPNPLATPLAPTPGASMPPLPE